MCSSLLNNIPGFIANIFIVLKKVTIIGFLLFHFPVSVSIAFIETNGKWEIRIQGNLT